MKRNQILLAVAALSVGSLPAVAGEIFKYTDEDGNVSYVDRPMSDGDPERVNVTSARTDPAAAQARYDERYGEPESENAENADNTAPAEEEPERLTRRERAQQRAERQQKCQSYRDRMATLADARRIYREDENGERVYLDDAQRDEARTQAQERIDEFCD